MRIVEKLPLPYSILSPKPLGIEDFMELLEMWGLDWTEYGAILSDYDRLVTKTSRSERVEYAKKEIYSKILAIATDPNNNDDFYDLWALMYKELIK